jgi:thioesterase domain-containing protein
MVHAVGGSLLAYHELARALPEEQPLYGFERPGLEDGVVEHLDVERLAEMYLEPLRRRQPHGPYFLAGWSFGGLVAFELARQLEAAGERVAFLGLIDTLPPAGRMVGLMQDFAEGVGLARRRLAERELLLFGDPAQLGPRVVARFRRVLNANLRASRRYWPKDRVGAERVVLFRAAETEAETRRIPYAADWQAFSRFPVDEREIAGNHYSILERPHVALLAQALGRALEGPLLERPAPGAPEEHAR